MNIGENKKGVLDLTEEEYQYDAFRNDFFTGISTKLAHIWVYTYAHNYVPKFAYVCN